MKQPGRVSPGIGGAERRLDIAQGQCSPDNSCGLSTAQSWLCDFEGFCLRVCDADLGLSEANAIFFRLVAQMLLFPLSTCGLPVSLTSNTGGPSYRGACAPRCVEGSCLVLLGIGGRRRIIVIINTSNNDR